MPQKCKYCGTSFFNIVTKEETYITDGIKQTRSWVGCVRCWENLQRVI